MKNTQLHTPKELKENIKDLKIKEQLHNIKNQTTTKLT